MKKIYASQGEMQLGFDMLLADADELNRAAVFEKEHGHLPRTMEEALPYYCGIIGRHHAAMIAGDAGTVMTLRDEAHNLALRLNNGEPGILAGPDAPGCMLENMSAAEAEVIPRWGQRGSFTIEVQDMRVRIKIEGLFGIGSRHCPWMNFSAHAVDWDKPFLSETGNRSFMGLYPELVPGKTPDSFAADVIAHHVARNLKGRLKAIDNQHRPRP